MVTQYAERDAMALDDAGGYYILHVCAMTKEGLHAKADIAAELGFRDMQIAELTKQRDELLSALESASAKMKKAHSDMFDQCLSNPVKNAWGKSIDVSSINDLQLESSRADKLIAKAKGGAE